MFGNELNCFVPGSDVRRSPTGDGKLSGLKFAIKDCFDIEGHKSTAGNPDWYRSHEAATTNAPVVKALLANGAELVGVTTMDELAYSIFGVNTHYPAPVNIAAPGRVTGGSSSGSSSAVAGEVVDFAIGGDTGGSIRVPASFCGIYGIRTTHGRVSEEGVVPLAPTFDAVGWFARDPEMLCRVGEVLLGMQVDQKTPNRFLVAEDMFALANQRYSENAIKFIQDKAAQLSATVEYVKLAHTSLEAYRDLFLFLQPREVGLIHSKWVEEAQPKFAPDIAARFARGRELVDDDATEQEADREDARRHIRGLIDGESVICAPSTAGPAPMLDCSEEDAVEFRAKTMLLTSPAGLAGLPQINVPGSFCEEAPMGVGFIATTDESLLGLVLSL